MLHIKYILTFALLLLLSMNTFAEGGEINGKVYNPKAGENIPFANIVVLDAENEEMVTAVVSDRDGSFNIENLENGTYHLVTSFIGFKSDTLKNLQLTGNQNLNLDRITLEPANIGIEEVEITSMASTSSNKIDRTTYRASDFATAQGGTAVDILNKLPSVTVDADGRVSVRGTPDLLVYINGKPTMMESSMVLNQISSDNILNIDIITVPTAKYDAQGKGGIINIETRQSAAQGLSVSADLMGGATPWTNIADTYSQDPVNNNRYSGGFNLSYNKEKVSVNASFYRSRRNNKGVGIIDPFIYQDAATGANSSYDGNYYRLDGTGYRPKWYGNLMATGGIGYKLTGNSEISASFQHARRTEGRAAHYVYDEFFSNGTAGDSLTGSLEELYNPNDINREGVFNNLSLDYRLEITETSAFTTSLLLEKSDLDQEIDNREYSYTGEHYYREGTPNFHSLQNDGTPLTAARFSAEYEMETGNGNIVGLGIQPQWVRMEGSFHYDTVNANGDFAGFDYYDNSIDLVRDIYAGYVNYSGQTGTFSYIAGIRMEYLQQELNVENTNYFADVFSFFGPGRDLNEKQFVQNSFDLFPTIHADYNLNERNKFSLAASRRINRPPTKNMSPFLYRRHQEIFMLGDPLLEPEYILNSELGYTRRFGDNNVTLTGFYRGTNNAIYRVNNVSYEFNRGGVLLRSYTNSGNQTAAGAELGINLNLLDKAKLFLGGNLYDFRVEADERIFGDQKSSQSTNWSINGNLGWNLIRSLKLTLDYHYNSPTVTPQGRDIEFQMTNLALEYSPLELRGWNFSAKVLDLFQTNQSGGYTTAYDGDRQIFKRGWVYDYSSGPIIEIGASYAINMNGKSSGQSKSIGADYF